MTGQTGTTGPGPRDALPHGAAAHLPPAEPPDTDPPAAPPTPAPGDGPVRRVVRVRNPNGLHPRLADRFIRTAGRYSCTVTVWNGDARADGKNLWDLIMLVVLPDAEVVLEVDGPDAPAAVEPLCEVLGSPAGEDYTI
jgi:phosphotransferase system HPr (HPr) family protein